MDTETAGEGSNGFTFKGGRSRGPKKALNSFRVGDVQPAPGWLLLEEILPEATPGSGIVTHGKETAPDGQVISIHRSAPKDEDELQSVFEEETWRIIATGSDFIPNTTAPGGEVLGFYFEPGDAVMLCKPASQTAILLAPSEKDGPARLLCQMLWVSGRVAKEKHMESIHGKRAMKLKRRRGRTE